MMKDDQRQFHIERSVKQGGEDVADAMNLEYDDDTCDTETLDRRDTRNAFAYVMEHIEDPDDEDFELWDVSLHWKNRRVWLVNRFARIREFFGLGNQEYLYWLGHRIHIDEVRGGYVPKLVKDFLLKHDLIISGGYVRRRDDKRLSVMDLIELQEEECWEETYEEE